MSETFFNNPITHDKYDAVLFDLDGVLTATAKVHAACWKKVFDEYLQKCAAKEDTPFQPFEIATDYRLYVDGKLRYDGVRDFLRSRGIALPDGTPDDPAKTETVCGLGNRKDEMFNEVIESEGVEAYEGSVTLVRHLRNQGIKTGVVSSSHHLRACAAAHGSVRRPEDAPDSGRRPDPSSALRAAWKGALGQPVP